jgi:peptide/nickel transport system permease protein
MTEQAVVAAAVPESVRGRMRLSLGFKPNASLMIGAGIIAAVLLASLFAGVLSPYDPIEQNLRNALKPPSLDHIFGTDNYGRDIFTRVLHAAKLDLMIGFLCVVFPWMLGIALGGVAGYFGGIADAIIMRIVDTFTAFPFLIMVIGIIAILGPGLFSMYVALTLAGWSMYARIVRAEVLVAKKSEYVLAARALGYSHTRIMARHILPNVITPTVVFAMTDIVLVILSTTSLSFLGLGVQPPTAEWGVIIGEGKNFILTSWWMVTLPGLAIILVAGALAMIADGAADLLRARD